LPFVWLFNKTEENQVEGAKYLSEQVCFYLIEPYKINKKSNTFQ